MLDETEVATAFRAIFRIDATPEQIARFANDFATLDDAIAQMTDEAVETVRAVKFYQVFFNRLPDPAGLDFWTTVIRTNPEVPDTNSGNNRLAKAFFDAGEFEVLYGDLTAEEVVRALYQNVLGREADAPGLMFWTGLVLDPDNNFGLQQLGAAFARAPETDATFNPLIASYLTALGNEEPVADGATIFDFAPALTAVDDAYMVDEDGSLTVAAGEGVLANDTQPPGESGALEAVLLADVQNGTLTLNASGLFTYTPNADFSGEDSFTYEIRADDGTTETATATITVTGVNDVPVADDTSFTTAFGAAIVAPAPGLLDGVTDADGDDLSAAVETGPANGTVEINTDGSFTYTPNAGFAGEDSFTYTISDGNEGSVTATATVTVEAEVVNEITLAPGQDVIEGGEGREVISGIFDPGTPANTTIDVVDDIDGGAGTDRLDLRVLSPGTVPTAAIAGIENFFITNTSGGNVTFDFAGVTGEEQVWADRIETPSTATFTNLGAGTVIGLRGDGSITNSPIFATYAEASSPVALVFDAGVRQATEQASIDVNDSTATSATITSTGAPNQVGGIGLGGSMTSVTIDAATDLTIDDGVDSAVANVTASATQEIFGFDPTGTSNTITVTGAGVVDLGDISGNVQVVDASANTGGLSLSSLVNDAAPGGGNGRGPLQITGTGAADVLLTNSTTVAMAAGEGDDRLVVVRSPDGTDPLALAGADLTGFETLESRGNALVDLASFSEFQVLVLTEDTDQDSNGIEGGFLSLSATEALAVTLAKAGSVSFSLAGAEANPADVLRLTVDDNDATTGEGSEFPHTSIAIDNVETLEFALVDDLLLTALTASDGADLSDTTRITVTGAADADVVFAETVAYAADTVIDASALEGRVFFDGEGSMNPITVLAGAAGGNLLGSQSPVGDFEGDVLVGGASAELISGRTGIDTVTGGGGADTFGFSFGDANAFAFGFASGADTITDYEVGVDKIRGDTAFILAQNPIAPTAGVATLNAGIASFNGVDDTLAERVEAVFEGIQQGTGGAPTGGEAAVFEFDGDSYLFVSNNNSVFDTGDLLIELSDVTDLSTLTVDSDGDLLFA